MGEFEKKRKGNNKVDNVKIFTVPFTLEEKKESISISTNTSSRPYEEQIIMQAIKFHSEGNIKRAAKYYQYCIDHNLNDPIIFSNYGIILKNLGKLKEAELLTRKAIEIQPDFADAYINLGNIFKDLGEFQKAELYTGKAIQIEPGNANFHYNIGNIFKSQGKFKEAEISFLKAIELNPDFPNPHINLGSLFTNVGKLKEAEISFLKAIKLKPNLAKAYFALSTFNCIKNDQNWCSKLFSKDILNNQLPIDQIDIYFARANILHKKRNYKRSAENLQLANKIKLNIGTNNINNILKKSKALMLESNKKNYECNVNAKSNENIFIVGMPRSGSTLIECILSMNPSVNDLSEINIFEESFIQKLNKKQDLTLAELYWQKAANNRSRFKTTVDKWLYNYQYSGIIANRIPNAKIIHCYRNPLDNILSIYRAHFSRGNEYASSLVDCARVYLDQDAIMSDYKNRFRSKIYDLNYDSLVSNPNKEIKCLISWLGWEWDQSYLSPHLSSRSVLTASNIQVRSPINSKSIGGWRNYKDMLKPAIEILTQTDKYQDITS